MRPKPSRKPTTRSAAPHASQNSQNSGRTDSTLRKRTQSRTPHTPQKNITIPIQPWYGVSLSIRSLALGLRAMMSDEAARMPPAMVISPESMEFLPMGCGRPLWQPPGHAQVLVISHHCAMLARNLLRERATHSSKSRNSSKRGRDRAKPGSEGSADYGDRRTTVIGGIQ